MKDDGVRVHDRTFHTDHDNGHDRGGRYSCIVRGGGDEGTGRVASLTLLQASFRPVKITLAKAGEGIGGEENWPSELSHSGTGNTVDKLVDCTATS